MNNYGIIRPTGQNALSPFVQGMQTAQYFKAQKQAEEGRNALAAYAANPGEGSLAALAQTNPELAIRERARLQGVQAQQATQRQGQLPIIIRLLEGATDEASYQRSRQIAADNGIDVSRIPEAYGDGTWVRENLETLKLFSTPEGQQALSGFGKQAQDLGYQPGTPEFNEAVRELVIADAAIPYTGSQGETRLYRPNVSLPDQGPQILPSNQRPAGKTDDQLFREAREAVENGADVDAVFRQLREWGVQVK